MKAVLLIIFTHLVFSRICFSQQALLSPAQQQLSVFAGTWTIEGSESSYLEICNWIQGNHIQCKSTSKENGRVDSSISYLTYSAAEKVYIYYGLSATGSSRTLRGNWLANRFVLEGQRTTSDNTTKWKVTITPVNQDIHFVQEVSVNDAPWEKNADFIYKRIQ